MNLGEMPWVEVPLWSNTSGHFGIKSSFGQATNEIDSDRLDIYYIILYNYSIARN